MPQHLGSAHYNLPDPYLSSTTTLFDKAICGLTGGSLFFKIQASLVAPLTQPCLDF